MTTFKPCDHCPSAQACARWGYCNAEAMRDGERLKARQGHKYDYFGVQVIAMESGERVKVREVQEDAPWLGAEMVAHSDWLKPMPMKYHGGEVPCAA